MGLVGFQPSLHWMPHASQTLAWDSVIASIRPEVSRNDKGGCVLSRKERAISAGICKTRAVPTAVPDSQKDMFNQLELTCCS